MGALHFAKSDFKGQSITLDNFVDRNRPETSLNRLSDSKIFINQFKISYCPYSRLNSTAYTISMTYPRYNICILYIIMECMSNRWDSHRIILHKTFRNVKYHILTQLNVYVLNLQNVPTTIVSSGISSIKHFFSVSPMWKYKPDATEITENKANANMLLVPILVQIHRMLHVGMRTCWPRSEELSEHWTRCQLLKMSTTNR